MAFLAHIGMGFAIKPISPKVPLGVLIAAAMWLDLFCFLLMGLGVASESIMVWTHGLFASALWSLAAGVAAGLILKDPRSGVFIGAAVFSHWVIDFITHPMFGSDMQPDIPLFLEGSPKVGLGLYRTLALGLIIDIGALAAGIAYYIYFRRHRPAQSKPADK